MRRRNGKKAHETMLRGGHGNAFNTYCDGELGKRTRNVCGTQEISDRRTKRAENFCVMNAAICDFDGKIGSEQSVKRVRRLPPSREGKVSMALTPADKLLSALSKEYPFTS